MTQIESEINALKASIKKYENKIIIYYIGFYFGILLAIVTFIYFLSNKDLVSGFLSMLFIAFIVIILNYISIRQAKKRISELNKDLKKEEQIKNA